MREIKITIPEELFSLVMPEKAISHVMKARKEILLAFRSLIDAKIEALEKKEQKKVTKKKKIKIE
ncbi:MAG: hypothetical protein GTO17_14130 [Candidatus Aminicenantes bacterium]|nr:hypothetical protein [Candidatus Aminicenantes bacterium]